jgi:predicted XRE-type DNA-binding protein
MKTTDDDMELIHGSGNLFRDLGRPDPETKQLKAVLAAAISKVLREEIISTRRAQEMTGINHSDFARVRSYRLDRFTIDRLISMLEGLGQEVEVSVKVQPRPRALASQEPTAVM